jgi:hypothetical protein
MGLYDFCVWVQRLMRACNLSHSICDRTGNIAEEDVFLKSILELPSVSITNKRGGQMHGRGGKLETETRTETKPFLNSRVSVGHVVSVI